MKRACLLSSSRKVALFLRRLCLAVVLVGAGWGQPTLADEISELLQVLKDKGILSEEEFNKIKDRARAKQGEPREEAKSTESAGDKTVKAPAAPSGATPVNASFVEAGGGAWIDKKHSFPSSGGIVLRTAEEQHVLMLRARAELDYRQFGGDDGIAADTFDVRRAYLGVEGWLYGDFEYRVRASYAGLNGLGTTVCTAVGATGCTQTTSVANSSNTELDEAWLNINWWPAAQFKIGQFKMPFSLEQMQTETFTDFLERSMGDTISPGKERGVQVWGFPKEGVSYAIAVSNGQGINANETNNVVDNKDWLLRGTANLPALFGNRRFIAHFGASYSQGTVPVGAAFSGRTEARGITFFTPDSFTGDDVDRRRTGVEAAFAYGPVKFQAEWMRANFTGRSAADGVAIATSYDKNIGAAYASVVWMVTGERYADFYRNSLFLRPRPASRFALGGGGWGAWELGLRYSRFDASDFQTTTPELAGSGVKPATSANEATAWTFGIKWLPNPNVRLMLNYIQTKFDTPVTITNTGRPGRTATTDSEHGVTFRTQVDF